MHTLLETRGFLQNESNKKQCWEIAALGYYKHKALTQILAANSASKPSIVRHGRAACLHKLHNNGQVLIGEEDLLELDDVWVQKVAVVHDLASHILVDILAAFNKLDRHVLLC